MFKNLSDKLSDTFKKITGQNVITEKNIQDALLNVKNALIDADVPLQVINPFLENIRSQSINQEVKGKVNPGQLFIKIVHDELVKILGNTTSELNINHKGLNTVLMAGLQGSGKTTTLAKLARMIKSQQNKKVMVVSCDVYRPAAIEQLRVLAEQTQVDFFKPETNKPQEIATAAKQHAIANNYDVLLVDTAGRLHIDAELMNELQQINKTLNPQEILFVIDSMIGQTALEVTKAFDSAVPITGVILTKTDSDNKGGVALSTVYLTQKPIKFIGVGEKVDQLEKFHPERIASRILGMGDILSLVEEAERKVDKKVAEQTAKKFLSGQGFDFEDLMNQLIEMKKMGGVESIMNKLPGSMSEMASGALGGKIPTDQEINKMVAIIRSMTPDERKFPLKVTNVNSRKKRITKGSGTSPADLNKLIKYHQNMQKITKKFGNPAMMAKLAATMKNLMGDKLPF